MNYTLKNPDRASVYFGVGLEFGLVLWYGLGLAVRVSIRLELGRDRTPLSAIAPLKLHVSPGPLRLI